MSKLEVFNHCQKFLERKLQVIQNQMAQLKESLASETKSSAGDKHETGRALIQLEQEKLSQQLLELEKATNILQRVDPLQQNTTVHLGSLVRTDKASYFLAVSCDVFRSDVPDTFCISVNAPIAQAMLGKQAGESFVFNGISHTITQVE